MIVNIHPPLFILRRIVRANPWLLAEEGKVRKPIVIPLGPFTVTINSTMELLPEQRAKLLAEHARGTLFPK